LGGAGLLAFSAVLDDASDARSYMLIRFARA